MTSSSQATRSTKLSYIPIKWSIWESNPSVILLAKQTTTPGSPIPQIAVAPVFKDLSAHRTDLGLLAAPAGIGPTLIESKSIVLPLNYGAIKLGLTASLGFEPKLF